MSEHPGSDASVREPVPRGAGALIALAASLACTPKVQVEAPKEPITINMNIKIDHEIRVKVDKDLDQLIDKNDELF